MLEERENETIKLIEKTTNFERKVEELINLQDDKDNIIKAVSNKIGKLEKQVINLERINDDKEIQV